MRPAPRFRCPTSEFPIWPRGSPTDSPHVTSVACGHFFISPSMTGVRAASTAFPSFRGFSAQPSRTMSPARGTAEIVMNRRVSLHSARRSLLADVRRLRPLGPLGHLERDLVPFLERPEAVPDDRAVVHEHVRPARALDESEALRLVEPLHLSSLSHRDDLLFGKEPARPPRRAGTPDTPPIPARSMAGAPGTPDPDP